ncbi:MAG: M16 family metallopeptidase [Maritimibacter sp.]
MKRILTALVLMFVALPAVAEIDIQEFTTPGGIKVWLVEEHSLPFTALELRFRGGASLDAPGKRGAINLMTGLIEEGAGDLDARAYSEARETLATSIGFDVDDDALSVSARFLSENRDQAVELIRVALNDPLFTEDAIERVRGQVISGLKSRANDPNEIAADAFAAAAFGDHPYGSYLGGTLESVASLTRQDMLDAFAATVARDRVYVSAVGDVDAQTLGGIVDTILGGLPETGAPMPEHVDFAAPAGVQVIDYDTPQSVARFGHIGIAIDDPDFFAAYLINTVFGGSGFNSRLMDEVREKRGLTYGIGSYLLAPDYAESVLGAVSSQNDRMAETIEVVRAEWAKLAQDGVSAEELEKAKLYLTGAYPLRFDGNATIARILVGMQMSGYSVDYPKTRNERVNAVTLEEANRVARELYKPEALSFVVVGRPVGVVSTE